LVSEEVRVVHTDFGNHIPEELFDEFAMDMLSQQNCAFWEEHLLICPTCQDRLAETDEYIRVVKFAAATIWEPPPGESGPPTTEFRKRRGLMKPMTMAATHAGCC
jgi:hypothetical protein